MADRRTRGLIALNLGLLGVLALVSLGPAVSASGSGVDSGLDSDRSAGQPTTRARGDYTMVAGSMRSGTASAIWLLDKANQEMVIVRWDEGRKTLQGIDYRDLTKDAKAPPSR